MIEAAVLQPTSLLSKDHSMQFSGELLPKLSEAILSGIIKSPLLTRLREDLPRAVLDKTSRLFKSGILKERKSANWLKWRGSRRSRRCKCGPLEECTCGKRVDISRLNLLVVTPVKQF